MRVQMLRKALSPAILGFYFCICFLLIATDSQNAGVLIWGGFSPTGGMGLNIIAIIRWNLCVMPPVIACNLFMVPEIGKFSSFTMLRERSVQRWFFKRYFTVVLTALSYIAVVLIITTVFGLNKGVLEKSILRFGYIFLVHILLLITASIGVLIKYKSVKASLLLYFTVEGIMVVVGSSYPSISGYLMPFWGMANNSANTSILINSFMSFFLMCLIVVIIVCNIKKDNPAGTFQVI